MCRGPCLLDELRVPPLRLPADNGASILVDGTSCSAPTFSGMISLINDRRIAVGKSSLGYLN
ncbi:hypothetical protein EON67_03450, partial [archaeon]